MRIAGPVTLVVMLALAMSGCSLTFQRHGTVACSPSRRLPYADLALVGAEVLTGAAGMLMHDGIGPFGRHEDPGTILAGTALFVAVVQTASAGNGFRRAAECRAARAGDVARR